MEEVIATSFFGVILYNYYTLQQFRFFQIDWLSTEIKLAHELALSVN